MNKLTFNAQGKEYYILKYFKNSKTNKNYIVYKEENNDEDLFASSYDVINDEIILNEIESDEEWDYIDSVLEGENE